MTQVVGIIVNWNVKKNERLGVSEFSRGTRKFLLVRRPALEPGTC
jgi:hypothetical protein